MRNNLTPLRPGLTAIAAVLALSATPVFAQEAQTAPAQDAPVISAPAPTAVSPTADTVTAQSVTTEDTSQPLAAPAPMATRSPVVIHTAEASAPAPIAKNEAPKRMSAAVTRAVPEAAPAPTPAATPRVETLAPPTLASDPAPVAVAKTSTTSTVVSDDRREIELAGIGAVGLIVLIGGAVALTRRKRDDEDGVMVTTVPVASVEPVAYRAVETAPVSAMPIEGAPTTALNEGFDLSRYGPHVQTAYRGPTEDNPSLSLRHRLKRARFMDQRARENGETIAPFEPAMATARKPAAQNLFGAKLKDGLRSLRPQPGMRPAFS